MKGVLVEGKEDTDQPRIVNHHWMDMAKEGGLWGQARVKGGRDPPISLPFKKCIFWSHPIKIKIDIRESVEYGKVLFTDGLFIPFEAFSGPRKCRVIGMGVCISKG